MYNSTRQKYNACACGARKKVQFPRCFKCGTGLRALDSGDFDDRRSDDEHDAISLRHMASGRAFR